MNEDWIESRLKEADVPPSGTTRERTVRLARALAPERRAGLRSRIAKPRVLIPLTALMIAAMTAPGQAATGQVSSLVARIVPIHSQTAVVAVGAAGNGGSAFSSTRTSALRAASASVSGGFRPTGRATRCGSLNTTGGPARPTTRANLGVVGGRLGVTRGRLGIDGRRLGVTRGRLGIDRGRPRALPGRPATGPLGTVTRAPRIAPAWRAR